MKNLSYKIDIHLASLRTSEANLSLNIVSALAIKNSEILACNVMLCNMSNCMQLVSISLDLIINKLF
jgi:hypothetical protein